MKYEITQLESSGAHSCITILQPELHIPLTTTSNETLHLPNISCWGSDSQGQTQTPAMIASSHDRIWHLSCGAAHTCIVTSQWQLVCWGGQWHGWKRHNVSGMDSLANTDLATVQVGSVSAGYGHNCVVSRLGTWKCIGENDESQC